MTGTLNLLEWRQPYPYRGSLEVAARLKHRDRAPPGAQRR
jgi:hypothetical protein